MLTATKPADALAERPGRTPAEIALASSCDALMQLRASMDDVMESDSVNCRKLEALRLLFHAETQILGINCERECALAEAQRFMRKYDCQREDILR